MDEGFAILKTIFTISSKHRWFDVPNRTRCIMARICVLGGGLVGRYVACKLLDRGHNIRLIDSEEISDLPAAMEVI